MLTTYAHIDCVKRAKGGETMIELFALGPCNMTFSRKKRSLYMAAAFGISNYFIAVAHLDAKGNYHLLRHFFNAECSMTPDYKATALFCKEAEKAAAFAKKESAPARRLQSILMHSIRTRQTPARRFCKTCSWSC